MFKKLLLALIIGLVGASITPCDNLSVNQCKELAGCEVLKVNVLRKTFNYGCENTQFCGFYKGTLKQKKAQCLTKKYCVWYKDMCKIF